MAVLNGILEPLVTDSDELSNVVRTLHGWNCCPRCILRYLGEKQQFIYRKSSEELFDWVKYHLNEGPSNGLKKGDSQDHSGKDEGIMVDDIGQDDKASDKSQTGKDSVENGDSNADTASDMGKQDAKPDGGASSNDLTMDIEIEHNKISFTGEGKLSDVHVLEPESASESVCAACMGILQDQYCSQKFREELKTIVDKKKHQFDTYFCSLMLPVSIWLREHSIYLALRQLLPKVYTPATEDDVTPIKDSWKWHNGGALADLLGTPFDMRSLFDISLHFVHPDVEKECKFLFDVFPDVFRKRKSNRFGWEVFTRANVVKAMGDMSEDMFRKVYQSPPKKPDLPCDCTPITCSHEAIWIAGRYNKYSRTLSQTPWVLGDGERRSEFSVEEYLVNPLNKLITPDECRFSSSGREDVDVKMLGTGRPFVLEFVNPHRIHFSLDEMKQLQTEINSSTTDIAVRDLQVVTREETARLKEGEIEKVKRYSAVCWSKEPITQDLLDDTLQPIKDLVLKQKTPIRVLHRRTVAVRDKIIHSISGTLVDKHNFTVCLATQAGTYIKEFVHGDFGRTTPNLGTLLDTECDISELDVDGVELDWPKQLDT